MIVLSVVFMSSCPHNHEFHCKSLVTRYHNKEKTVFRKKSSEDGIMNWCLESEELARCRDLGTQTTAKLVCHGQVKCSSLMEVSINLIGKMLGQGNPAFLMGCKGFLICVYLL